MILLKVILFLFMFLFFSFHFIFLTCWFNLEYDLAAWVLFIGKKEPIIQMLFLFPSHVFFLCQTKEICLFFIICMSLINCLLSPLPPSRFFHQFSLFVYSFIRLFVYSVLFFKRITYIYIPGLATSLNKLPRKFAANIIE